MQQLLCADGSARSRAAQAVLFEQMPDGLASGAAEEGDGVAGKPRRAGMTGESGLSREQLAEAQARFVKCKELSVDLVFWLKDMCEIRGFKLDREGVTAVALAFGTGLQLLDARGQLAMLCLALPEGWPEAARKSSRGQANG